MKVKCSICGKEASWEYASHWMSGWSIVESKDGKLKLIVCDNPDCLDKALEMVARYQGES